MGLCDLRLGETYRGNRTWTSQELAQREIRPQITGRMEAQLIRLIRHDMRLLCPRLANRRQDIQTAIPRRRAIVFWRLKTVFVICCRRRLESRVLEVQVTNDLLHRVVAAQILRLCRLISPKGISISRSNTVSNLLQRRQLVVFSANMLDIRTAKT